MHSYIHYVAVVAIYTGISTQAYAHEREQHEPEREYKLKLQAVNNSGVVGEAEIKVLSDNEIQVAIEAEGLEVNKPHPQHLHGFNAPVKKSVCPDIGNDSNGDGLVTIDEAAPVFGPIILPFVPFDTVDANGEVDYKASFTINPASLQPLEKRTIVLHGMTVNGEYIPSLPVACGEIILDD